MTTVPTLPAELLRMYDVRGTTPAPLNQGVAYAFGRRFGYFMNQNQAKTIVIGYDGRLSSPALYKGLTQGLIEQGINITNVGLCPTPMLSFAHFHDKTDAAIMITGSHNPKDDNGFKITFRQAPFFDKAISNLNLLEPKPSQAPGSIVDKDILHAYIDRLLENTTDIKPLSVVWDIGHGAAGVVMPELVKRLPGRHALLFERVDGNFPAHHPDPTVEKNLETLKKAVIESKADVGIAFDGDADRIGVVDDKGTIIWADLLLILLATQVLRTNPRATIIADVKASGVLFDAIANMEGVPVMAPTGHSIIKKKLKELNAPLAGEMSGHIFFADKYYGYDDAIYAAIRLLQELSILHEPLSQWYKRLPQLFSTPEIRVPYSANKDTLLNEISCNISSDLQVDTMDGLRVTYPDGRWWLLRPSNTQDILVIRCEAFSKESLESVKDDLNQLLNPYNIQF